MNKDILHIKALKTNKSQIKINDMMKSHIIPKHPSSILFCGKSGSGKTNLLSTLLTEKQFYKGYFDLILLFSETAKFGGDDLYTEHLKDVLPPEQMFEPNKAGIEVLKKLIKGQKKIIKNKTIVHAPKILLIFDDVAHSRKFLASHEYLLLHIANRHLNISTFSLMQSYVKMPRSCRCQCSAVVFFHGGTNTEMDRLSTEHCPPNYNDKEFLEIVKYAIRKKYSFMMINKHCDMKTRYREGLHNILELDKVLGDEPEAEKKEDEK